MMLKYYVKYQNNMNKVNGYAIECRIFADNPFKDLVGTMCENMQLIPQY